MRIIVLFNISLWVVLLVVFTTITLPGNTFFWNAMQNAGHGLAMCLAAFTSILSFEWKSPKHTRLIFIIVPLILLGLGVIIELVQHIIGRGFSLVDVVSDTAGIIAGTCLSSLFISSFTRNLKLACSVTGLFALCWCVHNPAYLLANKWLAPTLPVVANFEQFAVDANIHSHKSNFSIGDHQAVWPASNGNSLQVNFAKTKWNDFRLVDLMHDWSDYNAFALEVLNVENEAVSFNIELLYQPGAEPTSATMIAQRIVQPGQTSINIPLEDFVPILATDGPNFTNIMRVIICVTSPNSEITLYFDELRVQ